MFEMKCLRKRCGVTIMDRIRNEVIRDEVGVIRNLAGRAELCAEVVWSRGAYGW